LFVLILEIIYMVFFCLLQCPVLVAWGEKDPWEPVELGRAYASFDTVEDFVVLPDVGHCPQVLFVTVELSWLLSIAICLVLQL
jgi:hypothetical protein